MSDTVPGNLDKIEALIDWCRDHVRPPPSDLLYAAAGAVANMRHEAGSRGGATPWDTGVNP